LRLDNKIAIVTGAGRGIGEAISTRLAKEGANIAVCDIDIDNPNFRPELLSEKEIRKFFNPILSNSDIILPTTEEVMVLTGKKDLKDACREILKMGPEIVAVKQGKEGSSIFTSNEEFHIPAFKVGEIDPTGAGDCYCAGFIAGIIKGLDLKKAVKFANAVGALAATKKGPMEGVPTMENIEKLIGSSIN